MEKRYTKYVVGVAGMTNNFETAGDAKRYLVEMQKGFPGKVMSDENRQYWKTHSERVEIREVTEISILIDPAAITGY